MSPSGKAIPWIVRKVKKNTRFYEFDIERAEDERLRSVFGLVMLKNTGRRSLVHSCNYFFGTYYLTPASLMNSLTLVVGKSLGCQ